MKFWPTSREWLICRWHGLLDYDQAIPKAQRHKMIAVREAAKIKRLERDAVREARHLARIQKRGVLQAMQDEARAKQNAAYEEYRNSDRYRLEIPSRPAAASSTRCQFCCGKLERKTRATDSGMGCLILIIGLILAPILIGIPIIIAGICYMSKSEAYWECSKCGNGSR